MSEINIGDRVKFLNTSGGGIVSKIIDSKTVSVLIEDGFEIPTMVSELVVVNSTDRASRFFEDHYNFNLPEQKSPEKQPEPEDDRISSIDSSVVSIRKSEDIYLAFVPHDQKWLITGPMDVLLINNTGFDLLYSIFHRTPLNHFQGIDYGNVFPDSTILLATINREQISTWSDGSIQLLFHREQLKEIVPPFNAEFRIDGKKFFKEGNYRSHTVIREKGIFAKLVSLNDYFAPRNREELSGDHEKNNPDKISDQPLIKKYQTQPGEAEIDLHIHELIEDPGNMDKGEMLDFQKNYFEKCLDSAMVEQFRKLTIIHGVGNGVLKNSILDILKKYEGISFNDAPMSKYGAGALEIRIFRKNH